MRFSSALTLLSSLLLTRHSLAVTVYYQNGQTPLGSATTTAASASYTGAAAYDPTVLTPPQRPPDFPLQYTIQIQNGVVPEGLSIPQLGSFFGFSIEMSVIDQVCTKFIQIPFLNLMSNLIRRSGRVNIRVGGNTQETAKLVDHTPSGRLLEKDKTNTIGTTQTPPLIYTRDVFYLMRNISDFVNIRWFLGVPFKEINPLDLNIAVVGAQILGDYLIGLQGGNEPDLYQDHGKRPAPYGPQEYFNDFRLLTQSMNGSEYEKTRNMLLAPSLAGRWLPDQVWDLGFVDEFNAYLKWLSMEHYPLNNCAAVFGTNGQVIVPQEAFASYLTHRAGIDLCSAYLNSTMYAQQVSKPFVMFETNTASCGGFPGISDSFGSALWGLDYALQMAYSNFSMALFHVGGQNVYYNPFTPPPTNQSTFRQWTIGPIYYSSLVMAEVLGSSDKAQVYDMWRVDQTISEFSPAYLIYEDGKPVRAALFNYVTDPSGGSDINVSISFNGGSTPANVNVKYLRAASVSQKGNFTWAGQTFGDHFASDGRFLGDEDIQTVACNQGANTCVIKVPAPSFALVFLTDNGAREAVDGPSKTFATTAHTKTVNTATFDPSLLATSNGHKDLGSKLGSTSKGSLSNRAMGVVEAIRGSTVLASMIFGGLFLLRSALRW
ncbi:glycoside hydrolase family 79 protein [Amanita thiersii Skay4041]|uniref:Glycoside hydrolase family 79 protein n=1 Tax=Amanita thiersii Skay4041 TaxID=703135 RepID=A0A2A9NP50_9AGAR|nr:glycoside hydrolase family 79 protein [Amanita thiersii Skay4041]